MSDELEKKVADLKGRVTQLEGENGQLKAAKEKAEAERLGAVTALENSKRRQAELAADRERWRKRAETAEKLANPSALEKVEQLAKSYQAQLSKEQSALHAAKEHVKVLTRQVDEDTREKERLKNTINHLQATLEGMQKARDKAQAERDEVKKEKRDEVKKETIPAREG